VVSDGGDLGRTDEMGKGPAWGGWNIGGDTVDLVLKKKVRFVLLQKETGSNEGGTRRW